MTKADKRIIELWFHSYYLWYTISNVKNTWETFLQLPYLLQVKESYDPDNIFSVWRDFLLTEPRMPTDDEMLLAIGQGSSLFKPRTNMFEPFYRLKRKARKARVNSFRTLRVQLTPKIQDEHFHQNVLTYMRQIHYTYITKGGLLNDV